MTLLLLSAMIAAAPPKPGDAVALEMGLPIVEGLPQTLAAEHIPDTVSAGDVYQKPERYPVRIAVLRAALAVEASYKLKTVSEIVERRLDAEKKTISEVQEKLAATILKLREANADLQKAAESRSQEPSARWLAHLDFLLPETKLRAGMLEELNLAYGKVHRNDLAELDAKANHTGWKLDRVEKMLSKNDVRKLVEEAQEEFEVVKKTYAGTVWGVLAERELTVKPGLAWVSAEVKSSPMPFDPRRKRP